MIHILRFIQGKKLSTKPLLLIHEYSMHIEHFKRSKSSGARVSRSFFRTWMSSPIKNVSHPHFHVSGSTRVLSLFVSQCLACWYCTPFITWCSRLHKQSLFVLCAIPAPWTRIEVQRRVTVVSMLRSTWIILLMLKLFLDRILRVPSRYNTTMSVRVPIRRPQRAHHYHAPLATSLVAS